MKIFCIGRNYRDHAAELNNPVPSRPLVFMKPPSALLRNNKVFYHPEWTKDVHHEIELVIRIERNGKYVDPEFADEYYTHIALGIDFTARDLQSELKKKGHPWEIAKGFDGSAPISKFVPIKDLKNPENIEFSLSKNGEEMQHGFSSDMIFNFNALICHISKFFKLQTGDLIYTGTPAGVSQVQIGDKLEASIEGKKMLECRIK